MAGGGQKGDIGRGGEREPRESFRKRRTSQLGYDRLFAGF